MTAPYTFYAASALRWYFKHETKPDHFFSRAIETNWETCEKVVKECDPDMIALIREVYLSADTVGDAVYEAAKKHEIHQDNIWTMLTIVEKHFAKERGLI